MLTESLQWLWELGWQNQGASVALLAVLGWLVKHLGYGLARVGVWMMQPRPTAPEVLALVEAIGRGAGGSSGTRVTLPGGAITVAIDGDVRDHSGGDRLTQHYSEAERHVLARAAKARLAALAAEERAAMRTAAAELAREAIAGNEPGPAA
jgi:hypothetical protein